MYREIIQFLVQYNTVKPNLKGPADLLRFKDGFGFKKANMNKKNSGLDISFGSSSRFRLNVFGLTVFYCINNDAPTFYIFINNSIFLSNVLLFIFIVDDSPSR